MASVRRSAGLVLIAVIAMGCGGGSSAAAPAGSPTPQPAPQDQVQQTSFSAVLGVDLAKMTRRASGLYVQDLQAGTGPFATRGKTIIVRYTGWLPDGKQFDSSEITVTLGSNKTIRAWEEGLLGMRVGGRRRLIVPPALGYGDRGNGEIPPNAVLVFDMEVTSIL